MNVNAHKVTLNECLGYLEESMMDVEEPTRPKDLPGKRLFTVLDIGGLKAKLQFRIDDLQKGLQVCDSAPAALPRASPPARQGAIRGNTRQAASLPSCAASTPTMSCPPGYQ